MRLRLSYRPRRPLSQQLQLAIGPHRKPLYEGERKDALALACFPEIVTGRSQRVGQRRTRQTFHHDFDRAW